MEQKKTIYIAGAITGTQNYWEAFEEIEQELNNLGYTVLTPARLPQGMTKAQYMRICFSMIDSADAVVFLSNWRVSEGATLEREYCRYTSKPAVYVMTHDFTGERLSREARSAFLENDLEEVLKRCTN